MYMYLGVPNLKESEKTRIPFNGEREDLYGIQAIGQV